MAGGFEFFVSGCEDVAVTMVEAIERGDVADRAMKANAVGVADEVAPDERLSSPND